jgi:small subunit ribosomal protein S8
MMTDPVADLLTRVRNANVIGKKEVSMPASTVKVALAQILKEEGFIRSYGVEPGQPSSKLTVQLKYGPDGERVLRNVERISKPGRRVYTKVGKIPPVLRGMGIYILSTPRGIVSDRTARKINAGGELLCRIY